jgi:hypothetical protein
MVRSAGQLMLGGVLSSTKMVWLQEAEFPQASVETQVRVVLYSCTQAPGAVVVDKTVIEGEASHKSLAIGIPKLGVAGHSRVALLGQVIFGGVLSCTAIV